MDFPTNPFPAKLYKSVVIKSDQPISGGRCVRGPWPLVGRSDGAWCCRITYAQSAVPCRMAAGYCKVCCPVCHGFYMAYGGERIDSRALRGHC